MALRLLKDELCLAGGLSNFKITRSLLQSVKRSHTRYQAHLEAEKKVKGDQERKKKEEEQENEEQVEKEKTKSKLNQDISFTKDCIKKLESTLSEANQDISNALKAPVFVKERVVKAHVLIDMPLERKRNLEKTLDELVSEKQKLS